MILLAFLSVIVYGVRIFPNKPYQLYEIQWIHCDQPDQQYKMDFNKLDQENYFIDNKSICSNNITFDIPQKQLYYYFVFATKIRNKLTITIDDTKYMANVERLQNYKNMVILHTHNLQLTTNISIEGMNNYFQQLYIFSFENNSTKNINKTLYYDIDHIMNPVDETQLQTIKLLSLESKILKQKYINLDFKFKFRKLEQVLCHFNILKLENITIDSLNDQTIQISSQLEIKKDHKYNSIDFILRVESTVEIKQIFGGNYLDYIHPFDLIIQTDGENNFIQSLINKPHERMKLYSEIRIFNFPENSTLFIEIKPKGIQCPNLSIVLDNLSIKNNNVQWNKLEQISLENCSIQLEHSFTNEGEYQVEVSAKMEIQDFTFYLENQGSFTIYRIVSIENHLDMVLIVYFGTIILFICIFTVIQRKYSEILYNKFDSIYFKALFVEEDNQNGQQQ